MESCLTGFKGMISSFILLEEQNKYCWIQQTVSTDERAKVGQVTYRWQCALGLVSVCIYITIEAANQTG